MKQLLFNKLSAFLVMLMCMSATVQAEVVHHTVCEPTFSTRGFNAECWENTETNKFYYDANCTRELTGSMLAQAVSYAKMPTSPITSIVVVDRFAGLRENHTLCGYNFNWAAVDSFQGDDYFSFTVEFEVKEDNAANARLVWGIYQHPNATSGNLTVRIYVNDEIVYHDIRDWGNTLNVENLPNVTKGDNVRFVVWPELSTINYQFASRIAVSLEYTFDCHHEFPTGSNTCSKCGYTLLDLNTEHHRVCEPTLSTPGYTRECWENLDNGKFYSDAACTQELSGAELAKTVVYETLSECPVTGNNGFNIVESDNVQTWGVQLNWAAEATFENTSMTMHPTRYAEFKVGDDYAGSARLVWMKNQGAPEQGRFTVNIYVNDVLKQTYNQNNNENMEGVVVVSLPEVKKGDVVRFEVQQNSYASYAGAGPTFKACIEYTLLYKTIKANENPDEQGKYYTTFYDGRSAFSLSENAKAYTGIVNDGELILLTPIEDNIIPMGEAVIIRSTSGNIALTPSDSDKQKNEENRLRGSDTDTEAPDGCYILSYGQNGLGFYRYAEGNTLAAHKAFLINQHGALAKAFRMIFAEDIDNEDGIESPLPTSPKGEEMIYNLQGVRMSKLQKGINIVGGKKIIVK